MRRHRIRLLITSTDTGGAESFVLNLVQRLDRGLFEPLVCSLRSPGRIAREIENSGTSVLSLHLADRANPLDLVRGLSRIRQLIEDQRVDLIQSFLYRANFIASIATLTKRRRCVAVTGQHSLAPMSAPIATRASRLAHRYSTAVVAVSEAVKNYLIACELVPATKITVIPNGVDTEVFEPSDSREARAHLGIPEGRLIVGTAARLTEVKNVNSLISAFAKLLENGVAAELVIAGDGPQAKELQKQAASLAISDWVHFLGMREDLQRIYTALDLFVLPSLREGSPTVILEAMASGCPVIATAVGGIPELVEDGITGMLVEPNDQNSLFHALDLLARDQNRRKELSERGRTSVLEHFDFNKIVGRYESLFLDLLQ